MIFLRNMSENEFDVEEQIIDDDMDYEFSQHFETKILLVVLEKA